MSGSGPNDDNVNNSDDDDDSDEWATEDLPDLPVVAGAAASSSSSAAAAAAAKQDDDDEGWARKLPPPPSATSLTKQEEEEGGFPMILVDMTQLSNGQIHSKFDANAVNDPPAVRRLRLEVEQAHYNVETKNNNNTATWVADGTVVPCGSTVWRPALERLRRERPGHHFCPVFPPKQQQSKSK